MRRILMGIVWYFVLRLIIGGVFGIGAALQVDNVPGTDPQKLGYDASMHIQQRYGWLFVFVSLGLAVYGTKTGLLPGTKKPNSAASSPSSSQPYN
jgi:hypothetical protein